MALKDQIKTLLQEADLYRNQGLLNEARAKYRNAAEVVKKNEQIKNRESLLAAIQKKIAGLEADKTRVEKGPSSPRLSAKAQDLIQKLFSFSDENDGEGKALEGAVALAKFGQFERALTELQKLLPNAQHRVEAAKNILNCHLSMADTDQAIAQYKDWLAGDLFDSDQLERLRAFLEDNLRKHGVKKSLPKAKAAEETKDLGRTTDEEFIDISSIGITFDSGPSKGNMVEFDVNFQSGNIISLIIPSKDKALIENLNTGYKLNDIQFYSPIAIFKGTGIVSSKTQIKSGPKQGDFCLDIKITST
jgi:tetratricopeptide (TPR) repeat protein